MAITINGSANTVAGLTAGGLPDNTVDGGNLAMGSDAAGDILYYNGTDYIRLAKGTDGQILKLASGVPTWADASSGGLTEVDQWRSTTNFAVTKTPIDSGWERNDTTTNGFAAGLPIGTGMSESSGVFTFGATGKYKVEAFINIHHTNASNLVEIDLQMTGNNGTNWATAAYSYSNVYDESAAVYAAAYAVIFCDVTDLSNHKIRLCVTNGDGANIMGATNYNHTGLTFMKLGDT